MNHIFHITNTFLDDVTTITGNNWNLWNYGACYCYNVALVLRNGVVHVYCRNNALEYPCMAPLMVGAAQLMKQQ
jgi:hypothetical protein